MILGIAGKIASGKTMITQQLGNGFSFFCYEERISLSAPQIIEVDTIGHRLFDQQEVQKKIGSLFCDAPSEYLDNLRFREWLRKKVYASPPLLKKIESILHPPIRNLLFQEVQLVQENKKDLVFVCALPLTFQLFTLCKKVLILPVQKDEAWQRIQKRTPDMPEEYFEFLWEHQARQYEKPLAKNTLIVENIHDFFSIE